MAVSQASATLLAAMGAAASTYRSSAWTALISAGALTANSGILAWHGAHLLGPFEVRPSAILRDLSLTCETGVQSLSGTLCNVLPRGIPDDLRRRHRLDRAHLRCLLHGCAFTGPPATPLTFAEQFSGVFMVALLSVAACVKRWHERGITIPTWCRRLLTYDVERSHGARRSGLRERHW